MSKRNVEQLRKLIKKEPKTDNYWICLISPSLKQMKVVCKRFPGSRVFVSMKNPKNDKTKIGKAFTKFVLSHPQVSVTYSKYLPIAKYDLVIFCTVGKKYKGNKKDLAKWIKERAMYLRSKQYIAYHDRKREYYLYNGRTWW
ncbi:MAG: hypothetical protein NC114_06775 [Ruminococcus flavefaciens]|nr:hypothetical protein [Ruminococcus flavefaciens]